MMMRPATEGKILFHFGEESKEQLSISIAHFGGRGKNIRIEGIEQNRNILIGLEIV